MAGYGKDACGAAFAADAVDYDLLAAQMQALAEGVESEISNLANASALLYQTLADLNWAGFYLYQSEELRLGPFQGKTACTRIAVGKGVCGTAAQRDETVVVENVHQFPGHIACDGASRSEIVIPIHRNGALYGVLDIDSPLYGRFGAEEKAGLEKFVSALEKVL